MAAQRIQLGGLDLFSTPTLARADVLADEQPEAVWASAEGLEGYEWSHAAPSHVMATFWFPGECRVFWECSPRGLGTRGESAENDTEPPITGMDGLLVMEATIASYESSRLEKRIKLRNIQGRGVSATDTQSGVI